MLIVTQRKYQHWPSWDLVYEWEDEMLKSIDGSKLFYAKEFFIKGHHALSFLARKTGININSFLMKGRDAFMFAMSPDLNNNVWDLPNISTNIIDCYPTSEMLPSFYNNYSKVKNLYVSSREVYEYLMQHNPEREVKHLPLTLPDKYKITKDTTFEKKYDLVMVGRQSPTMLEYLHEYEKNHLISYVYRGKIEGGNFPYYTNKGDFVGFANTRDDYFKLMHQSRVALYSTPGIDDGKQTNGFHQVTPRFLEEIACGCHVISQYIDNADTEYFELGRMSTRVNNYKDFEQAMENAVSEPVDMKTYSEFLEKHYTSIQYGPISNN